MLTKATLIRGFNNGIKTTVQLSKVMLPIYVLVVLLKHSGLLETLSQGIGPLMKIFGLPAEAAYPLVLGNILNLYAGIGSMSAISLTGKQITIIALMLLICHNIIVETAVVKSCGIKVAPFVWVRVVGALIIGIAANILI